MTTFPPKTPFVARFTEKRSPEILVRNGNVPEGAWIEATGAPLRDNNGRLCGGVVAFRDITQVERAARNWKSTP